MLIHSCQAATSGVRVLARCSICSAPRSLSTSLWLHGMLAWSLPWGCAAACVGIRRCQGRALAHTQLPRGQPQAVCVCWRGAVYVRLRDFFQPAFGCMGRWPGHQHAGALPPASGSGAPVHTASLPRGQPQAVCVCLRGAVYVPLSGCFQPASGSMGRWPGHQHAGALPPASGLGGARGALAHRQLQKGAATSRACVLALRSLCSTRRALSTSLWLHGTLARSPTCMCAAARVGVLLCTQLLRQATTSRACVLTRRRICSRLNIITKQAL